MHESAGSSRHAPMRRLATLGLVFVAAILSCGKDVTGPLASAARYVRGLAFDPVFPPLFQAAGGAGSGVVQFSKVHVVLHHSDGSVALDTTIDFPAGADSLTIDLTVKLLDNAPSTGEPMSLNLGYINAAGDTVFKGGPVSITAAPPAVPGQPNPPVQVPVSYTGPGAAAAAVVISPRSLTVSGGGAFSFTAVAKDALGNDLPGTPIIWNTLDPSLATVTSPAAGSGVVGNTRGTARIQAQLLTGATDQVTVTITLPASQLLSQGGNAQSAVVGATLPQPLVVKVAASDGVGVAGVTVSFAVAGGGGSVTSASVVSDANGLAQTTWKLGSSTGSQSVTATAGALSGSPLTFTATAQAASATKLVVTTQPVNGASGSPLGAVVFTAQDDNGNVASGFTGAVTVAFAANAAGGTLAGTTTVNAVAGVATFSALSVAKAGSAYTLAASATGLTGATTSAFDIVAGAPAKLVFSTQPAGGSANLVMTPLMTVSATDAQGNLTPSFTGAVTLSFSVNPSGATLLGPATQNAVAGVATFPAVGVSLAGTGYQLTAAATGLTSATSSLFNISGGVAANITVSSGGAQTGLVGLALPLPVVVKVADAGGIGVAGVTVNFAAATGGGSISPVSGVSDGAGLVTVTWTLGATVGAQSITATSTGLTGSPLTIAATGTAVVPTLVKFTTQPVTTVAGTIMSAIVVTATDAMNQTATTYGGNVTLTFGANPGGATLSGTTTVAAVAGVASFNNISLNKAAAGYTLNAASGTLTPAVSIAFGVNAVVPGSNIAVSAGNGQSGSVSTLLATPLAVLVTDAFGNPSPGNNVNWAVASGGGSVSVASSVTNASGIATTAWTLGPTAGAGTVTATSAGLIGSPLTFNSTALAAGFSKTWTGATNTSWTTATNWSPAGVPVLTDGVFIPLTANNPVLSGAVTLTNLTIAPSASLSILANNVTITGNLDAGTTIIGGGGTVVLAGTGTLQGTVNAPVSVTGTYSTSGTTTLGSSLALSGAGSLYVLQQTNVAGNFSTAGTATLSMGGTLWVSGNATFGGGDESGKLTTGGLILLGNFTQTNAGTGREFNAGPSHTVLFEGTGAQTISFADPDTTAGLSGAACTKSCFGSVEIFKATGTLTYLTSAQHTGALLVEPGTGLISALSAGSPVLLTVTSALNTFGSTHPVHIGRISVRGNYSRGGGTTIDTLILPAGGSVQPASYANVVVLGGTASTSGNTSISGDLLVDGGTFSGSGAFTINVGGNLTVQNGGHYNFSGATLNVTGNATFNGGPPGAGSSTAMNLSGNFSQGGPNSQSFLSPGNLTLTLQGGSNQTISFATPDTSFGGTCSQSCFGNLTINKTAGTVTYLTSADHRGKLRILAGLDSVVSLNTLAVHDSLVTANGQWVHFARLNSSGNFGIDTLNVEIDTASFFGNASQTIAGPWNSVSIRGTPTLVAGGFTAYGDLGIGNGGTLTLGGQQVSAWGNFFTTGTGALVMNMPSDSLFVMGQATFGGGAEAGKLTNGALVLFQGIVVSAAGQFSASGSHVTYLVGPASEECDCSDRIPSKPGLIGPSFSRAGSRAGSHLGSHLGSRTVVQAKALLAARRAAAAAAMKNARSTLAATVAARKAHAAKFTSRADAVRQAAAAGRLARGLAAPGTRTGPARKFTAAGRPAARLMISGAPKIGGASGGRLRSASVIPVQSYSDSSVYVAFADTTGNQFANVRVVGDAQWQTFTRTSGDVLVDASGDIEGNGRLSIGGNLIGSYNSTVEPEAVEVFGVLSDTGYFSPDTTLFSGVSQIMPSNVGGNWVQYYNVVVNSPSLGVLAEDENEIDIGASLIIQNSGQLRLGQPDPNCSGCDSDELYVYGALETHGSGKLQMNDPNYPLIYVSGNAWFDGGSTAALLTQGEIDYYGNFSQTGSTTAYSADSPHYSYFGTPGSTIQFANPGAALSHFGDLYFGATQVILQSSIYANGMLESGNTSAHQILGSSAGFSVTSGGADVRDVTFDGVTWTLLDGYPVTDMDAVTFVNEPATATQFTVRRNGAGGMPDLTNWIFSTSPPLTGAGRYINAYDTDGAANGLLTINLVNPIPVSSGGLVTVGGAGANAVITGWSSSVTAAWTGGASSSSWSTAGNWSTNAVPISTTDVIIATASFQPTTGGAVSMHNLTVNSGATLTVSGASMIVNGDILVQPTGKIDLNTSNVGVVANGNVTTDTVGTTGITTCAGPSSAALNLQTGVHTVTGKFCNLSNFGTYTASGPIQVVGSGSTGYLQMGNGGSLNFNGHRIDTYAYNAGLGGNGTITMHSAADSLFIHGGTATFQGGSETGLMTAGAIIDRGPTLTATGTGFDASGGSQMLMVDTNFVQNLNWNSAVPGHGFNDVTMKGTQSKTFGGSSDQWITGTLLFDVSMNSIFGTVSGTLNLHVRTLVDNSTITAGAFNGPGMGLHMTGNGTFTHDTLRVNNVHFDAGGNFTLSNNLTTHDVVVDSGSRLILNGHTLKTQGYNFTTLNGGTLQMTNPADSLDLGITSGTAYFNGGSTAGLLTNGGMAFANLFQGFSSPGAVVASASASSFSPSAGLRAHFATGTSASVAFHNPGTGSSLSHFWYLQASTSSSARLLTDVFVDSVLVGEFSGSNLSCDSVGFNVVRTVTTKGFYNSTSFGLALQGVAIVLNDGTPSPSLNKVTWTNFPASFTGDVLTVNRSDAGGLYSFDSNNFSGVTLGAGGHYLRNLGSADVHLSNPLPSIVTQGVEILASGTGQIIWPWSP